MIVSTVVIKDRLLLGEEGMVSVVLTIDKQTGQLLTSPDIISRGAIHLQTNADTLNALRNELRRAVKQRFLRVDLDRFKTELREHVASFLYAQAGRSPIIVPVVNVVQTKQPKSPQARRPRPAINAIVKA
jgi:ribonuclease J